MRSYGLFKRIVSMLCIALMLSSYVSIYASATSDGVNAEKNALVGPKGDAAPGKACNYPGVIVVWGHTKGQATYDQAMYEMFSGRPGGISYKLASDGIDFFRAKSSDVVPLSSEVNEPIRQNQTSAAASTGRATTTVAPASTTGGVSSKPTVSTPKTIPDSRFDSPDSGVTYNYAGVTVKFNNSTGHVWINGKKYNENDYFSEKKLDNGSPCTARYVALTVFYQTYKSSYPTKPDPRFERVYRCEVCERWLLNKDRQTHEKSTGHKNAMSSGFVLSIGGSRHSNYTTQELLNVKPNYVIGKPDVESKVAGDAPPEHLDTDESGSGLWIDSLIPMYWGGVSTYSTNHFLLYDGQELWDARDMMYVGGLHLNTPAHYKEPQKTKDIAAARNLYNTLMTAVNTYAVENGITVEQILGEDCWSNFGMAMYSHDIEHGFSGSWIDVITSYISQFHLGQEDWFYDQVLAADTTGLLRADHVDLWCMYACMEYARYTERLPHESVKSFCENLNADGSEEYHFLYLVGIRTMAQMGISETRPVMMGTRESWAALTGFDQDLVAGATCKELTTSNKYISDILKNKNPIAASPQYEGYLAQVLHERFGWYTQGSMVFANIVHDGANVLDVSNGRVYNRGGDPNMYFTHFGSRNIDGTWTDDKYIDRGMISFSVDKTNGGFELDLTPDDLDIQWDSDNYPVIADGSVTIDAKNIVGIMETAQSINLSFNIEPCSLEEDVNISAVGNPDEVAVAGISAAKITDTSFQVVSMPNNLAIQVASGLKPITFKAPVTIASAADSEASVRYNGSATWTIVMADGNTMQYNCVSKYPHKAAGAESADELVCDNDASWRKQGVNKKTWWEYHSDQDPDQPSGKIGGSGKTGGAKGWAQIKANECRNEDWEVLEGIPSTENLFIAAGAQLYTVDVAGTFETQEDIYRKTVLEIIVDDIWQTDDPCVLSCKGHTMYTASGGNVIDFTCDSGGTCSLCGKPYSVKCGSKTEGDPPKEVHVTVDDTHDCTWSASLIIYCDKPGNYKVEVNKGGDSNFSYTGNVISKVLDDKDRQQYKNTISVKGGNGGSEKDSIFVSTETNPIEGMLCNHYTTGGGCVPAHEDNVVHHSTFFYYWYFVEKIPSINYLNLVDYSINTLGRVEAGNWDTDLIDSSVGTVASSIHSGATGWDIPNGSKNENVTWAPYKSGNGRLYFTQFYNPRYVLKGPGYRGTTAWLDQGTAEETTQKMNQFYYLGDTRITMRACADFKLKSGTKWELDGTVENDTIREDAGKSDGAIDLIKDLPKGADGNSLYSNGKIEWTKAGQHDELGGGPSAVLNGANIGDRMGEDTDLPKAQAACMASMYIKEQRKGSKDMHASVVSDALSLRFRVSHLDKAGNSVWKAVNVASSIYDIEGGNSTMGNDEGKAFSGWDMWSKDNPDSGLATENNLYKECINDASTVTADGKVLFDGDDDVIKKYEYSPRTDITLETIFNTKTDQVNYRDVYSDADIPKVGFLGQPSGSLHAMDSYEYGSENWKIVESSGVDAMMRLDNLLELTGISANVFRQDGCQLVLNANEKEINSPYAHINGGRFRAQINDGNGSGKDKTKDTDVDEGEDKKYASSTPYPTEENGGKLGTDITIEGFYDDYTYHSIVGETNIVDAYVDSNITKSNVSNFSLGVNNHVIGNMIEYGFSTVMSNIDMSDFCQNGAYLPCEVTGWWGRICYNESGVQHPATLHYDEEVSKRYGSGTELVDAYSNVGVKLGYNGVGSDINKVVIHDPISSSESHVISNAVTSPGHDERYGVLPDTMLKEKDDYWVMGNDVYIWVSDIGDFYDKAGQYGVSEPRSTRGVGDYGDCWDHRNLPDEISYSSLCQKSRDIETKHDNHFWYGDKSYCAGRGYMDSMYMSNWIYDRYVVFPFSADYESVESQRNVTARKGVAISLSDCIPLRYDKTTNEFLPIGGTLKAGNDNSGCNAFLYPFTDEGPGGIEGDGNRKCYGWFFKFTMNTSAKEAKGAPVYIGAVAKNNDTDVSQRNASSAPDGIVASSIGILDGATPDNKERGKFSSPSKCKQVDYVDLVGRIGNFTLNDTGDYRFSNFFKTGIDGDWLIDGVVNNVDNSKPLHILSDALNILRQEAGESTNGHATTSVLYKATPDIEEMNYNYQTGEWESAHRTTVGKADKQFMEFPLTPSKNNLKQFKSDAMKMGYALYADVETWGNYYGVNYRDYDDGDMSNAPKYKQAKYKSGETKFNVGKDVWMLRQVKAVAGEDYSYSVNGVIYKWAADEPKYEVIYNEVYDDDGKVIGTVPSPQYELEMELVKDPDTGQPILDELTGEQVWQWTGKYVLEDGTTDDSGYAVYDKDMVYDDEEGLYRSYKTTVDLAYWLLDLRTGEYIPIDIFYGERGNRIPVYTWSSSGDADFKIYTELERELERRNSTNAEVAVTEKAIETLNKQVNGIKRKLDEDGNPAVDSNGNPLFEYTGSKPEIKSPFAFSRDYIGTAEQLVLDQRNRTFIGSSIINGRIEESLTKTDEKGNPLWSVGAQPEISYDLDGNPLDPNDRLWGQLMTNGAWANKGKWDHEYTPIENIDDPTSGIGSEFDIVYQVSEGEYAEQAQRWHFTIALPSTSYIVPSSYMFEMKDGSEYRYLQDYLPDYKTYDDQLIVEKAHEKLMEEHPDSVVVCGVKMRAVGEVWTLQYKNDNNKNPDKFTIYDEDSEEIPDDIVYVDPDDPNPEPKEYPTPSNPINPVPGGPEPNYPEEWGEYTIITVLDPEHTSADDLSVVGTH